MRECSPRRCWPQAGVRYAAKNPYSYVHANIGGHVSLLEAVKAASPMPAVVYASSSSVYGLNTKQPFSETDRVETPASLYASTKRVRPVSLHVVRAAKGAHGECRGRPASAEHARCRLDCDLVLVTVVLSEAV